MSFESASGFVINGATFNEGMNAMQYLYQHVARDASHDSKDQYEKPKCHPRTRNQLLSDIHQWIKVPEKQTGIMFLHGPAGAGKSCIARSACEQAAKEGLLGASFFFWRGSSSRNKESQLIATLAYQLAEANVELKNHILSVVENDPRIVDRPIEIQFRKLILEPCNTVPRDKLVVQAIIIDGLDECMGEETQVGILQMISNAVRHEGFPLGFLVTSRPELHLQEALDSKDIIFATNIISLTRIRGVPGDICTYLESGFIRILNNPRFKRAFRYVSRPWPTAEIIDKLVQDSSGQFIYAETVLKFVSDPDDNPVSQLKKILHIQDSSDTSTESSLANLDRLYQQIMLGVRHQELTMKVLSFVIAIKDLPLYGNFSYNITTAVLHNQNRLLLVVEQLLGISDGMAYQSLNQLHSLISLKVGSESTRRRQELDFYHKSFHDFLTTKTRSLRYYINLEDVHFKMAQSCLIFIGLPKYETEAQHVCWLYSCFQWYVHASRSRKIKMDISSFDATLRRFFFQSLNHINVSKLNDALQFLGIWKLNSPYLAPCEDIRKMKNGILGLSLPSPHAPWEDFRKMRNHGSFSWEFLAHAVNEVRSSLERDKDKYKFDKSYIFPLLQIYFNTYNNYVDIKLLLLLHCITRSNIHGNMECKKGNVIQALGALSNKTQRFFRVSEYDDLARLLNCFIPIGTDTMQKYLVTAEFSGTFYCTPDDFSRVYTAIISSGLWNDEKNLDYFCRQWSDMNPKVPATGPLLECLEAEALSFLNKRKLSKRLYRITEHYLLNFLRENLDRQTDDVIRSWERTFEKARSRYPGNFE